LSILVLVSSSDDYPPVSSSFPSLPPLCLAVSVPCNSSNIIKGGGFRVHLHNGEQHHVVVGGTKRRAAAILSDFGFKAKPGAPSPSGRSSTSACSHPSRGVVERKAKRGRTLECLVPQSGGDGVGHGGVWLGWETTAER
jgi:hypothetical protein